MVKNNDISLKSDVETIEYHNIKPQLGSKYYYLQHRFTNLLSEVKEGVWNDYDSYIYRLVSGNFFIDKGEANVRCNQRNIRFQMIKKQIKK